MTTERRVSEQTTDGGNAGDGAGLAQLADEPEVLWEDAELFAVYKPAGLVTHPTYKHPDGTLADAVFARQHARGAGRPWLLHRLDRETSGLVLFAKTDRARRGLVRQFERHTIRKRYLAVLAGKLDPPAGGIEAPLMRDPLDRRRTIVDPAGQPATTHYRTLAARGGYSLVLAAPRTGRTHQIRAHFASRGVPLLGDGTYLPQGHPAAGLAPRSMLHAWRLGFTHPATQHHTLLEAYIPGDMLAVLSRLGLDLREALQSLDDTFEEASRGTDIA
jgi:23S rRNA pseudouridine1911/1915/1917 synthase